MAEPTPAVMAELHRTVPVVLSQALFDWLKDLADEDHCPLGAVIEAAVREYAQHRPLP